MSRVIVETVRCDRYGCYREISVDTAIDNTEDLLDDSGWGRGYNAKDYCPEHSGFLDRDEDENVKENSKLVSNDFVSASAPPMSEADFECRFGLAPLTTGSAECGHLNKTT